MVSGLIELESSSNLDVVEGRSITVFNQKPSLRNSDVVSSLRESVVRPITYITPVARSCLLALFQGIGGTEVDAAQPIHIYPFVYGFISAADTKPKISQ